MTEPGLIEAVPNFSEGRDAGAVTRIAEAAAGAGAALLDTHSDPVHNRTVVSLASAHPASMEDALVACSAAALESIDLRVHTGVHPRVGAADVIPLVPLGSTSVADCIAAAHSLGERIWNQLKIPVYFYGLAARGPESSRLSAIRAGRVPLDLGTRPHPSAGAACVGVRGPLLAYNILLPHAHVDQAQALARALRATSGGMPGVQTMIFDLGDVLQLSMNLVDLAVTGPAKVLAEARRLAQHQGVRVGADEVVGLCPAAVAVPAASGRLLEARLAAAAARRGSLLAQDRPDEESRAVAQRLAREAEAIAVMGATQAELLAGTERAAALRRFLRRSHLLDAENAALLGVAVPGLRVALGAEITAAYAARVAALDAWLREEGRPPLSAGGG